MLSGLGLRIGMALAALLAVLAVLAGARNSGRQAERVDAIKRTLEIRNAQDAAAARVAGDDVADRLRDGRF
jgi:hypothetical protein